MLIRYLVIVRLAIPRPMPGTVTLETEGEDLYFRWIDVRETDPETAGETIKGELKRAIRRI